MKFMEICLSIVWVIGAAFALEPFISWMRRTPAQRAEFQAEKLRAELERALADFNKMREDEGMKPLRLTTR